MRLRTKERMILLVGFPGMKNFYNVARNIALKFVEQRIEDTSTTQSSSQNKKLNNQDRTSLTGEFV